MDLALAIDFGSTFTKGALFELAQEQVLGVAYRPSTVATDVTVGLRAVLAQLQPLADRPLTKVPAWVCSSAAGGLRMAVSGLVPSLSLEAAQRAALGAGAKIIGAYGHKLAPKAVKALQESRPDIVLLAGGIDGGDEETILHNARVLARAVLPAPIIVAGNEVVAEDCVAMLREAGHDAILAANILPDIDRVEVAAVHAIIRDLFVHHITRAKGIERVEQELVLAGPIVPTPSAVLRACQLLAEGAPGVKGWGDLVVVDIGGATTDIHSASTGAPTRAGVIRRGLPELYLKRTVEGDLGLRANAATIRERVGDERIVAHAKELGATDLTADDVRAYVARVSTDTEHVPVDAREATLDAALARAAIALAMRRHAGVLREVYTVDGTALVQEGKDLGAVGTVIGIGGVLAHGAHARFALEGVCKSPESAALCPERPRFLVDRAYLLYAIGLLADRVPVAAFRIAQGALSQPS